MRFRFPMFLKFWVGCAVLAALLIGGGVLVVQKETRVRTQGFYLEKHFKRYLGYQEGLSRATSSVTDALASQRELRQALASPATVAMTGPEVTPPPPAPAARLAEAMFEQLSRQSGLKPDLFVLFDDRALVWAAPGSVVDGDDLRELEAASRIRGGTAFFNKILIHGGKAFAASGVPIRALDGERTVGGLVIGVAVERFMEEYHLFSDDLPEKRHVPVLLYSGAVVASVLPRAQWPALIEKLRQENWKTVIDRGEARQMIDLPEGAFLFHQGAVEGFAGVAAGPVGQLFLLRRFIEREEKPPGVPWKEMVIAAILSLVVASLLALWITRPIKRFVRQSRRMLDGGADLNQRIEIRSSDETADLATNINHVFARLYQLASEVQSAAFQVGASSAEISAASRHMLEGLRDQTMKIESSTAAVTELSASIQQVAANAVEATKVAEKSNVAVGAAVDRMQQIRSAVEEAGEKMHDLGESSKRIGNIVEVIRQISEQTSLLALNASIEAAHAGEQGRGFAVVADEVSSLARRVGQSAKDIESLIQTIKEQTGEAMRSMQVGTREVEGGTELVMNTLNDLQQLISVVKDTAAAVQEQAMVSDEIARNMDAVQKIAAEMVSGSEEAVLQGEQLHSLAFNLEQSVGGFNIDGAGGSAGARNDGGGDPPRTGGSPAGRGAPPALRSANPGRRL